MAAEAGRLANGGVIALFWNHPHARMTDDPTNRASAEVYERLRPDGKTRRPFGEEDMEPIIADLCAAGFKDLRTKLYHRTRTLTTEQYIALLNTYSDHRTLDPALKAQFEKEMREALERVGGYIHIYDTLDLYLAEKRAEVLTVFISFEEGFDLMGRTSDVTGGI